MQSLFAYSTYGFRNPPYRNVWYLIRKVWGTEKKLCKAFQTFSVLSKFFCLIAKIILMEFSLEKAPEVKYFRKFSAEFNEQVLKRKSITSVFIFKRKILNLWMKKKNYTSTYLEKFCLMSTYLLDFNKWGLNSGCKFMSDQSLLKWVGIDILQYLVII